MAIVRYDPWSLLTDLQGELNRAFESRLNRGAENSSTAATSDWVPPVDIHEEPNSYLIFVDVPGVDPAGIEVHMENGVLSIRGVRQDAEGDKRATLKREERAKGTFYRRFTLPDTADSERISATSRNGVLQLTIPKHEKVQPRKIRVEA